MANFYPGKMEGGGWTPLPPGEYRILIKECVHVELGKVEKYDVMNMNCEVLEPSDYKGRKSFLSLFYSDYKVSDLVKAVSGKTLMETWTGAEINDRKIFDTLEGEFVKVRLGIKEYNGKKSNEIVEVISEAKKSEQVPTDI